MEELINMGFISIIPPILAIVLSFVTKNTIVSLAIACITGTLLAGQGLLGFPTLLKESLGTTSLSWWPISRRRGPSRAFPSGSTTSI